MKGSRFQQLPGLTDSYHFLYERTKLIDKSIREEGFDYMVVWECEWNDFLSKNPEIRDMVNKFDVLPPIQPRDAFRGGNTNKNIQKSIIMHICKECFNIYL